MINIKANLLKEPNFTSFKREGEEDSLFILYQ